MTFLDEPVRGEGADDRVERRSAAGEGGGEPPAAPGEGALRARVLIVDDDRIDRMAVRRHLAHASAEITVEEADGVLAAINRLTADAFDCVVLDYNLPDGDGLTFLRGLRTAGIEAPVVMLTGQDDAEVTRQLMLSGAAAYISKSSLSPELLLTSIRDAIQGRR